MGDYIALRLAQVFIVLVFILGMTGMFIEIIEGKLPL